MSTQSEATRTVDPYSLYFAESQWYLVGRDHDRDDLRVFRVSRIRGDIRFATRRERDFRIPEDFDPATFRDRADWQLGERVGEAVLHVAPSAAWRVERLWGARGRIETQPDRSARFTTDYANLELLVQWILGENGHVLPLGPSEVVDEVEAALRAGARRPPRRPAAARRARAAWWSSPTCPRRAAPRARSRPSASPSSRRCWPTCWSAAAPPRAARCRRRSCASATG